MPNRQEELAELFLLEHVKHVALVLAKIDTTQQAVARTRIVNRESWIVNDPRVVPGGHKLGVERGQPFEQRPVLDVLVTADARVWRASGGVFGDKVIDDSLAETLLEVHDVVADAELAGHAAGVVGVFHATALLVAAQFVRAFLGPEAHRHADDFVALFHEEGGGDGAIHAPGHTHNNARSDQCATISPASGRTGL